MSRKLVVGAFTPSVLLRVARRIGRLAETGLDVDEVPVASSPGQLRSLLDGDLDVVFTSPDNVVAYRFCADNPLGVTADVKIVAAIDRGLGLGLYARNGTTADQLRGAPWGVDVPTSGFAFVMYAAAESIGLSLDDYELTTLGSTPKRLAALLDGRCAATMLNAGNELLAEEAGCTALVGAAEVCAPYLGTVLAIAGADNLQPAQQLAAVLRETTEQICSGLLDDVTAEEATTALGLGPALAEQYVARLKDPVEGLVRDAVVDRDALKTVIELRRRYRPTIVDGVDVLAAALDRESGLVVG